MLPFLENEDSEEDISSIFAHKLDSASLYEYSAGTFNPMMNVIFYYSDYVGIDQNINKKMEVQIYPNPARDNIYIDTAVNKTTDAVIIDNSGKILQQIKINPGKTKVNIKSLPCGVYYLSIHQHNTSNAVQKFIVK